MELLNHFKFTTKYHECKLKAIELNKYVLEFDFVPLKYVQGIRISHGTVVIPDSEEDIVMIKKSLPIWDIMRNYLMIYLNDEVS